MSERFYAEPVISVSEAKDQRDSQAIGCLIITASIVLGLLIGLMLGAVIGAVIG